MAKIEVRGTSEQIVHLTHEVEILKMELEAQADQFEKDSLEREAEIGVLRVEIEALKKLLDRLLPDFISKYDQLRAEELRRSAS